MRTFPKDLAAFRTIVEQRGAHLRQLPFAHIVEHEVEEVVVGSHRGTIGTIVMRLPSGGIQVVVQGFLKHRFLPGSSVALDGFYKFPDETIASMSDRDLLDFS